MYKISEKTYALEIGDNIVFVRDGGGNIQLFVGDKLAYVVLMLNHIHILKWKAEYIVLEARK